MLADTGSNGTLKTASFISTSQTSALKTKIWAVITGGEKTAVKGICETILYNSVPGFLL